MEQEELEAALFCVGHCTDCGNNDRRLVMVQIPGDDEEPGWIDLRAQRRGLCEPCAVTRFRLKH